MSIQELKSANVLSCGTDVFNKALHYFKFNVKHLTVIENSVQKYDSFSVDVDLVKIRAKESYVLEISKLYDYVLISASLLKANYEILAHITKIFRLGAIILDKDKIIYETLVHNYGNKYQIEYLDDGFTIMKCINSSPCYIRPQFQNIPYKSNSNFIDTAKFSRRLNASSRSFLQFVFDPLSTEENYLSIQSSFGHSSRDCDLLIRDFAAINDTENSIYNTSGPLSLYEKMTGFLESIYLNSSSLLVKALKLLFDDTVSKAKVDDFISLIGPLLFYPPKTYDFIKFWIMIYTNTNGVIIKNNFQNKLSKSSSENYRAFHSLLANEYIESSVKNLEVANSDFNVNEKICDQLEIDEVINDILNTLKIRQAVIWGYKTPLHTHHFIHLAFFTTLKNIGVEVFWFDDQNYDDEILNQSGTLFVTMESSPSISEKMPVSDDNYYLIHRTLRHAKYSKLSKGHLLYFNELRYKSDVLLDHKISTKELIETRADLDKLSAFYGNKILLKNVYSLNSLDYFVEDSRVCFITWGTDLDTSKIIQNIHNLDDIIKSQRKSNVVSWVGSIWKGNWGGNYNTILELIKVCNFYGYKFEQHGRLIHENFFGLVPSSHTNAQFNFNSPSLEENRNICASSFLAPAFQGEDQIGRSVIRNDFNFCYVPDRLFKNISYGCLGVSNNPFIDDDVVPSLVNDIDVSFAFEKSMELSQNVKKYKEVLEQQMTHVGKYHTFKYKLFFMLRCLSGIDKT